MQRIRMPIDDFGVFALMVSGLATQVTAPATQVTAPDERGRASNAPAADPTQPHRGWLDRLEHWFWKREQQAREAYLAEATDIYDLEVRIRALERGTPSLGC